MRHHSDSLKDLLQGDIGVVAQRRFTLPVEMVFVFRLSMKIASKNDVLICRLRLNEKGGPCLRSSLRNSFPKLLRLIVFAADT